MKFKPGKKYDIVGVAHALVDVLAYVDQEFLERHQLRKGKMELIDHKRAEYLLENMRYVKMASGGSASNTMAGIASFGAKVALIGKVKDDELGAIFKRDVGMCGVDFCGISSPSGNSTGTCFVAVSKEDADRTMSTYLGAAVDIRTEDMNLDAIKNSSIMYFEGYLLDREGSRNALDKAMQIAHKNQHIVSMSLSDERCVKEHIDVLRKMIKEVDLLFANEHEIKTLFQTDSLDFALNETKKLPNITVVTMGKRGSSVIANNEIFQVKAASDPGRIIDTTGAGDLYASGFLFGIIKNMSLEQCAKLGSLAAAEAISHIGARPEITLSSLLKDL